MIMALEGHLGARGLRFTIVVSRFNSFVTDKLLEGALDALRRGGADMERIEIVKIPGAWEMPVTAAALLARDDRPDALICLGAVIRGETPHFDYVAGGAANGLAALARETRVPVALGLLTTDTFEQAIDRAGGKAGNKGFDAAMTAIEMGNLMKRLRGEAAK